MSNYKLLSKAQVRSIVDRANNKLRELNKKVIITTGVVFTSDKDFYYIFNIYKDNKIVDKKRANDVNAFDTIFKELADKYEVNIIYDYSDLTYTQINYLANEIADIPNKIEQTELSSAYMDSLLTF